MLLAIDAGNTDITFGLHDGASWSRLWRLPSKEEGGRAHWGQALDEQLGRGTLHRVVISSVVPDLTDALRQHPWGSPETSVLVVGPECYPALDITVANPAEMGTDLVCNAVAAYARFRQACVIVDFGTALTYTSLDDAGRILGVAIAPGLKTALRALSLHAAQLPEVPLEMPVSALGGNTIEAIQAGIVLGYTGMVKYMIGLIRDETGLAMKVIATGGLSHVLRPLHDELDAVDTRLTLEGLRLVGEAVLS